TIGTTVYTMGAYPSGHGSTVSVAWATGARVGADVLRSDKKRELVRMLDARVHDAWRVKKRELSRPNDPASCGPDVFAGEGPSFPKEMLDSVYVDAKGISFTFDFGFPHVVQACSPEVNLSLPWATARPFLNPSGILGR